MEPPNTNGSLSMTEASSAIPPPPPLPVKATASIPPPPPLPPNPAPKINNADYLRIMLAASGTKSSPQVNSEVSFASCYMFFYGSLMDPEVLQAVLQLPKVPTVRGATITGFSVKMWGIYPALVRQEGGEVTGVVWVVTSEARFLRLAAYETTAYTWCACDVQLEDTGEILHNCRTFCWVGDPDSKELELGSFDLGRYQRYFKPSVTRPHQESVHSCH